MWYDDMCTKRKTISYHIYITAYITLTRSLVSEVRLYSIWGPTKTRHCFVSFFITKSSIMLWLFQQIWISCCNSFKMLSMEYDILATCLFQTPCATKSASGGGAYLKGEFFFGGGGCHWSLVGRLFLKLVNGERKRRGNSYTKLCLSRMLFFPLMTNATGVLTLPK